jgi:hypothetical protein
VRGVPHNAISLPPPGYRFEVTSPITGFVL